MKNEDIAKLFLRIGLAFTLIYAGIMIFVNPESWIGYIPEFIRTLSGDGYVSLYGHAGLDLLLGVWLLSGWKTFWPALLTALNMFMITIFNIGALEIVFRDVGLLFAAIALIFLTKKR